MTGVLLPTVPQLLPANQVPVLDPELVLEHGRNVIMRDCFLARFENAPNKLDRGVGPWEPMSRSDVFRFVAAYAERVKTIPTDRAQELYARCQQGTRPASAMS